MIDTRPWGNVAGRRQSARLRLPALIGFTLGAAWLLVVPATAQPAPCTNGTDPFTAAPWVVCAANTSTAWISCGTGPTGTCAGGSTIYTPLAICQSLGYSTVTQFGGNCGSVCGFCESGTSCSSPGTQVFQGSGTSCGPGKLCNTVTWECGGGFVPVCGNGIVDSGEQCDDGNTLNGDCCSSTCQYEALNSPCPADSEACTSDICNGAGACTHPAGNGGATCRPAAGDCDVLEQCDGTTPTCPADGVAGSGVCRPATDVCDAPESCDGSGPSCPADGYLSSGECRASAGVCDVAENCDGSGIACPTDAKSTAPCRPVADVCDVAESCDGINDDCPTDGFTLIGTPCRVAVDDCDMAEACTGSSAACPADAKQPDDTACDDLNTCTQTDTCQTGICTGADPLDCDDGNACSADSCDPMGGCVNDDSPATGCLVSGKSIVLIKDNADDDTKDKLLWKWIKGAELDQMDLADPTSSASYALCVYAGTANTLIADAALPPGTGWSAIGTKGYKFKGTSPDGLSLAILKGGAAGKSKALAKGKGTALPDPMLPVVYPVTVQLKKDGSPLCLESTFTSTNEKKNTAAQFKAKK